MSNIKSIRRERVLGVTLSYLNTAISMLLTLYLTPALLHLCGESEYSVYKIMSSFSAPLAMMNFGIAIYVSRGIAQCNQLKKDRNDIHRQKVMGMSFVISIILCLGALLVSGVFYQLIDVLYHDTFSIQELVLAKKLYIILALNLSMHIVDNGFQGCITGNEKFTVLYGINLGKTILRMVVIFGLITFGKGTIFVALCDLIMTIFAMLAKGTYVIIGLHEKFYFHEFEKKELKIFFSFSVALLIQTIINNINNSLDNTILGAMISDKAVITLYSSALTIYSTYISVSYTISGVYHPQIIKAVTSNCSKKELTKYAVTPAKIQTIISAMIVIGFMICGKNFITIWIGERYMDAYYICLMLMVPASFVAISSIYEAFLDAKLKRLMRSLILAGMALYNLIISICLIKIIGFWGAAIGTATSLIIGNLIIMNLYSQHISGVRIRDLFRGAFHGIWKAMILSYLLCLPLKILLPNTFINLIIKAVVFCMVYILFVFIYGTSKEEKVMISLKIKHIFKR